MVNTNEHKRTESVLLVDKIYKPEYGHTDLLIYKCLYEKGNMENCVVEDMEQIYYSERKYLLDTMKAYFPEVTKAIIEPNVECSVAMKKLAKEYELLEVIDCTPIDEACWRETEIMM